MFLRKGGQKEIIKLWIPKGEQSFWRILRGEPPFIGRGAIFRGKMRVEGFFMEPGTKL